MPGARRQKAVKVAHWAALSLGLALGVASCGTAGAARHTQEIMRITLYQSGDSREVTLDAECGDSILEFVADLMGGTTEVLRLLVSPDRIGGIKSGSEAVEVRLPEPRQMTSRRLGSYEFRRVLIPIDDDNYIGDLSRPYVTLFLGNDDSYQSGPLFNPDGYARAIELRDRILSCLE